MNRSLPGRNEVRVDQAVLDRSKKRKAQTMIERFKTEWHVEGTPGSSL